MRCPATITFALVLLCALSASGAAQAPPNPASPPIDLDAKLKEQQQSIAADTQGKIDALEGKIKAMVDKATAESAQGRAADQRSIGGVQSSLDQLRQDVEQLKTKVTTVSNSVANLTKQDDFWTTVRLWLGPILAPLVTAFGFYFIYQQLKVSSEQARISAENLKLSTEAANRTTTEAIEEQTWNKAQFLADRVKDFQADKVVEYVVHALDFRDRVMTIEKYGKEPILFVHDQGVADSEKTRDKRKAFFEPDKKHVILTKALRYHEDDDSDFDQYEEHVRDDFDWFFFRLGQFEPMIESKLFSYEEFEIHLRYVLDLVSGGKKHVSTTLTEQIDTYVKKYDFAGVEALIARRQAARARAEPAAAAAAASADPATPVVATVPVPTSN